MNRRWNLAPLLVLIVVMGGVWSGCETRTGQPLPNQEPNTRISAGPPEASDTSFNINLFWFGWDDDGFIDYYEIAWESPEEGNWQGPIFSNDSLFTVQASDSCCVDPLPEQGDPEEAVYEQYHTFYVRAVDNRGVPDATPAVRSFNAKTVAPSTQISDTSPNHNGRWGTRVKFSWTGEDDDGFVTSYKYALVNTDDYFGDTGETNLQTNKVLAWIDTLTYYPDGAGGYDTDSLVWRETEADSVEFAAVQSTTLNERIIFAVRSIDNAGAEERVLQTPQNMRWFRVSRVLNGPNLTIISNIAGTWRSSDPVETREIFAGQGLRFRWRATPGSSGTPVAGFSYAVDDTSLWTPFSLTNEEWPEQIEGEEEILWNPGIGPHTFFVRAIDAAGFIRVLPARIRVFGGPQFCPEEDRYVLVVLDTQPGTMQTTHGIWPNNYEAVELGLIRYWFQGYDIQVHETFGDLEPPLSLMDCASSVFWFHSALPLDGDSSVLENYHAVGPNTLPSYVAAGGNLFLCGLQPLQALRYFETSDGERNFVQNDPVIFLNTVQDTSLVPHWAATQLGIARIEITLGNTRSDPPNRMAVARSAVRTGPNPYPDLQFDPLTIPLGPELRGFGFYDRGIVPRDFGSPDRNAQPLYYFNDTDQAVGIRRLSPLGPGVNGNMIYLGLHPWFVYRPQFQELVVAVMNDFGEFPIP